MQEECGRSAGGTQECRILGGSRNMDHEEEPGRNSNHDVASREGRFHGLMLYQIQVKDLKSLSYNVERSCRSRQ